MRLCVDIYYNPLTTNPSNNHSQRCVSHPRPSQCNKNTAANGTLQPRVVSEGHLVHQHQAEKRTRKRIHSPSLPRELLSKISNNIKSNLKRPLFIGKDTRSAVFYVLFFPCKKKNVDTKTKSHQKQNPERKVSVEKLTPGLYKSTK